MSFEKGMTDIRTTEMDANLSDWDELSTFVDDYCVKFTSVQRRTSSLVNSSQLCEKPERLRSHALAKKYTDTRVSASKT